MKKKIKIIIILVTICFAAVFAVNYWKTNFFRYIKVSDIEEVYITPWNINYENAQLSEEDIEALVPLLNQVKLKGFPTQDYLNWCGFHGYPYFIIRLKNGLKIGLTTSSPFYVINSKYGFRIYRDNANDYEVMYGLTEKYYDLMRKYYEDFKY